VPVEELVNAVRFERSRVSTNFVMEKWSIKNNSIKPDYKQSQGTPDYSDLLSNETYRLSK
jgi:hypothetical protein